MISRGPQTLPADLLGATLVALLLVAIAAPAELVCAASAGPAPPSNALGFKVILLKASQAPPLLGASVGSLHLAVPVDGRLIPGYIFVLPRKVIKTAIAESNETTYIPVIGEDRVKPSDILVAVVPQPQAAIGSSFSGVLQIFKSKASALIPTASAWGRTYVRMGLHLRVGLTVPQGSPAIDLASGKVLRLRSGLGFIIYFDRRASYQAQPADAGILKALARAVGLGRAVQSLLSPKHLKMLRERLAGLVREERIKLVGVQEFVGRATSPRLRGVKLPERLVNGGGGGSGSYYRFSVILTKNEVLSEALDKTLYLGPYVYNAGLMIRAESTGSGSAYVEVKVTVWRVGLSSSSPSGVVREGVVGSYDEYYVVGSSPIDIMVYPMTDYPSGKLEAEVKVIPVLGSVKVLLATFWIDKKYPTMPIPETREGIQVLSTGIASLGDYYTGTIPPAFQPARASQHVRVGTSLSLGLQWWTPMNLSFSYEVMNGVYVDSESPTYMYVDICLKNAGETAHSGSIYLYINGMLVGGQHVTLQPQSFGHIDFKVPITELLQLSKWSGGGLITVATSFKTFDIELFTDAVIVFKYAPEVWSPNDMNSWSSNPSAAGKVVFYQSSGSSIVSKASIVVQSTYTKVVQNNRITVLEEVSVTSGESSVRETTLSVRVTKDFFNTLSDYAGFVKTGSKFRNSENRYLGLAATAHFLISTGVEIASLVGVTLPEWVGGAVFVAGIIIDIVKAAEPGASIGKSVSGNYVTISVRWSPGWSSSKWVQLMLGLGVTQSSISTRTIWVGTNVGDVWILKPTPVKIVVVSKYFGEGQLIEPPGFYGSNGGGEGVWYG